MTKTLNIFPALCVASMVASAGSIVAAIIADKKESTGALCASGGLGGVSLTCLGIVGAALVASRSA